MGGMGGMGIASASGAGAGKKTVQIDKNPDFQKTQTTLQNPRPPPLGGIGSGGVLAVVPSGFGKLLSLGSSMASGMASGMGGGGSVGGGMGGISVTHGVDVQFRDENDEMLDDEEDLDAMEAEMVNY
jgi:hypothetical protein